LAGAGILEGIAVLVRAICASPSHSLKAYGPSILGKDDRCKKFQIPKPEPVGARLAGAIRDEDGG